MVRTDRMRSVLSPRSPRRHRRRGYEDRPRANRCEFTGRTAISSQLPITRGARARLQPNDHGTVGRLQTPPTPRWSRRTHQATPAAQGGTVTGRPPPRSRADASVRTACSFTCQSVASTYHSSVAPTRRITSVGLSGNPESEPGTLRDHQRSESSHDVAALAASQLPASFTVDRHRPEGVIPDVRMRCRRGDRAACPEQCRKRRALLGMLTVRYRKECTRVMLGHASRRLHDRQPAGTSSPTPSEP